MTLPSEQQSYWLDDSMLLNLPALKDDIACDAVIVGGGIAGLTIAYKLKKAGLKVVVLEKNTIASGTTGGTTGKVTTQHGLLYAGLAKRFGNTFTKQYATLSQQAFNDIHTLITDEGIACDWRSADNYVYTADYKKVTGLKDEVTVARALGLPASFETTSMLPFEIKAAVKFAGQAYFNAVKYVRSLAKIVNGSGCFVFENSEAIGIIEGQPCTVKARKGTVTAKNIVVATKIPAAPLIGRFTYAAYEYPVTSYIIAGKYDGTLKGMYISPDKSHYSLLPIVTSKGSLLLVGGESHLPGVRRPLPNHKKLAAYAYEQFGITDILYRWKAMDYIAYDSLPLIGKLYPWSKHAFMIGGFKKWGLNLSMVAANILTESIVNNNVHGLEMFSPHRLSAPASIPKALIDYFK